MRVSINRELINAMRFALIVSNLKKRRTIAKKIRFGDRLERFQCRNGECIAAELLCDGKADCSDRSDESTVECTKPEPEIFCGYAFRCKYGACVSVDAVCNGIQDCPDNSDETQPQCATVGRNQSTPRPTSRPTSRPTPRPTSRPTPRPTRPTPRPAPTPAPTPVYTPTPPPTKNACELPPQPPNGRWKLHPLHCADQEECDVQPGTKELSLGSLIVYSCNAGFKIRGTAEVSCALGGNWRTVPVCTEIRCKGLSTASVDARCRYRGKWERCETPVLPGTTANLQCRHSYRLELNRPLNQGNNVVCNDNGAWEPDPLRCVPGPLSINIYLNDTQLLLQTSLERNNATLIEILDDRVIIHTNTNDPNRPKVDVRIPKVNENNEFRSERAWVWP